MDEQQVHALVAGVHDRVAKQLGAQAFATLVRQHRDAKLGASGPLRIDRIGQMRHSHQRQSPVEHPKNFIPLKIQALHIPVNLLIGGGIAKTQVAVCGRQGLQMARDAQLVTG